VIWYQEVRQKIDGEFEPANTDIGIGNLDQNAGEMLGKEERFHSQAIKVPGNQSSFFQVIAGGRLKSQGKYVLRVRVKEFDSVKPEDLVTGNY
jgi:hypothetical protein